MDMEADPLGVVELHETGAGPLGCDSRGDSDSARHRRHLVISDVPIPVVLVLGSHSHHPWEEFLMALRLEVQLK